MRLDLVELGNSWGEGSFTGPDGRAYSRRSTRLSRAEVDVLVNEGAPVVCFLFGWGRFEWCDGEDALEAWRGERAYVVTSEPTAKALAKHHVWHAGVWQSQDDQMVVYLTGRC